MNMLSLASTSLWDLKPLDFLDAAAIAGFDAVGLRINASPGRPFHQVAGDTALIRDMKKKMADTGLKPLELFTFYLLPEFDFDDYKRNLETGAEFGARYCVMNCDDPDWSRLRDNFGRICDVAAPLGMTACIEFVAALKLGTLQQAQQMITEVGRSNTAITVDPSHMYRSGGHPSELVGVDPKLLPFTQIVDGIPSPNHGPIDRRLPGEGELPLAELLDALPAGLPLSIETGQRPAGTEPIDWAKQVMASTKRFLDGYYRTRP